MTFLKKVTRPIPCPRCEEVGLEIHDLPVEEPELHGLFLVCPSCGAKAEGKVVLNDLAMPELSVNMESMKEEK